MNRNKPKKSLKISKVTRIRADLNFWAINLKFLQVVGNLVVYKQYKFQIDSIKIEAYLIQNAEELSRI